MIALIVTALCLMNAAYLAIRLKYGNTDLIPCVPPPPPPPRQSPEDLAAKVRRLEQELAIAQENFSATNKAYCRLDAQLRERGGLFVFLARCWVKRQLGLKLKTWEENP